VPEPYVVQHREGGKVRRYTYQTGELGLFPKGDCHPDLSWHTPSDNIFLSLDDQYLAQLAGPDYYGSHATLAERLQFTDPLLTQLGRQLVTAVGRAHALGRLYAESLTNALCYHLLAHYATHQPRRPVPSGALSPTVLARLDAYLEAHAAAPVTLETLAGLANLSVFHFARRFKYTTGCSPYQYVLRWKITRARQLLRLDTSSVAELSDALGFASPASFAVAFKRLVGCTPQQYQRR
jgi:AraC family transcriptional regulator